MKKLCKTCGEYKDLELFVTRSSNKDGKAHICKECANKKNRERYVPKPKLTEDGKRIGWEYKDKDVIKEETKIKSKERYNKRPDVWLKRYIKIIGDILKYQPPKEKYITECVICGKKIENFQKGVKVCSKECRIKHTNEMSKEYRANWLKEYNRKKALKTKPFRDAKKHFRKLLMTPIRNIEGKILKKIKRENGGREKYNEYMRNNPELNAHKKNRRRDRISKASDGTITKKALLDLQSKQNNCCNMCGCDFSESGMHLDHIYPLSKGGRHTLDNVQYLCPTCNIWKSDKIL